MRHELELSGLDGSNPLAFFAALGALLALTEQRRDEPKPRLSWRNTGLWRPVLHGVEDVDALLTCLERDLATWKTEPSLDLRYEKGSGKPAHDLKPRPEVFRAYLERLLQSGNRRSLTYAAAFGTETATDNNGNVKPTALHFTAGQQEFLAMAQQLIEGVTRDDLLEALVGPWRYTRSLPVLQWDATADRSYALRASDPSKDKKQGVPGADWLAFRGLAFLPVAPVGDRVITTGCAGGWKRGHYTWPLWTRPTTPSTIRSLVGLSALSEMPSAERLSRGVSVVFRSDIHRNDQGGRGSIAPARVV
jgi:hypothetical protein